MAIQLQNAAQLYRQSGVDVPGSIERLTQNLIGIHDRKLARQRQAEIDALNAERQRQQMQAEEEARQLRLAEIAAKVSAMTDRPKETIKGLPSQPVTMGAPPVLEDEPTAAESSAFIQGAPPPIDLEVATPTPTFKLPGGFELPLYDRSETQARADEDFRRKLDQARQTEIAKGAAEVTPEMIAQMPESLRPFFRPGQLTEPPNISSFLAAQERGDGKSTPFENFKGVAGGYLERQPDGSVRFVRTGSPSGGAGDRPTPTSLLGYQTNITNAYQRSTKDIQSARQFHGVIKDAMTTIKPLVAQGKSLNPISQSIITAFNKITDPASVVRESEFNRMPEGQSYFRRLDTFLMKVHQGAIISPEELKDVEAAADAIIKSFVRRQIGYAKLAEQQAKKLVEWSGGMFGDLSTILPPQDIDLLLNAEKYLGPETPTVIGVEEVP